MQARSRRNLRIAAVIAIAAAAGHFMQAKGQHAAGGGEAAPVVAASVAVPVAASVAVPVAARADATAAAAALTPAGDILPPVALADPTPEAVFAAAAPPAPPPAVAAVPEAASVPLDPAGPGCPATLEVVASPGAMLTIVLTAPCRPEARVVLRHAGLAVTGRTSAAGGLSALLPAFDAAGAVAARFDDGRAVAGAAPVPDLAAITRFAVQWSGADAFQLRATREGTAATGGRLLALGDPAVPRPLLAEVFTFPADAESVVLDLEAPIQPATCGREMLGDTLQWAAGMLTVRELVVPMPDCGGPPGFLVLSDPLAVLTLAAE